MKPVSEAIKPALKEMFDIVMDDSSSEVERDMAMSTLIDGLLPNKTWFKKPPYTCISCNAEINILEWVDEYQCFKMSCEHCLEEYYS